MQKYRENLKNTHHKQCFVPVKRFSARPVLPRRRNEGDSALFYTKPKVIKHFASTSVSETHTVHFDYKITFLLKMISDTK